VDRKIPHLIKDQDAWRQILFKFTLEPVGVPRGGKIVDDVHGRHEQSRMTGNTRGVRQGDRKMSFAEANTPAQEDVGVRFQEPEREEMLDLGAIDLFGPAPLELLQGFETGEAGQTDAPPQALFLALLDLAVGETGQEVAVRPTLARRL